MNMKFVEGGPSDGPTNLVGRSFTTPTSPKTVEEPKEKIHTQEVDDESYPNKSAPTTGTLDLVRQHPFTNSIIRIPLPDKWKNFNRDRYDGTTDPDEYMDAYTTHMSLYTSDDVVLCRVFPRSLKGGTLSWFTRFPHNFVNCFDTLMSKFEI